MKPKPPTSSQLAKGIRSGSDLMYQCFYDRYKGFIYMRILALEPSRQQADELFQKVLVKIAKSKPRWNTDAQLIGWIKAVVRSVVCDEWRKKNLSIKTVSLSDSHGELPDGEASEREHLSLLRERLNRAFDGLKVEEKRLIESVYFEHQSLREVSQALGISYKALESKISRVKRKLRNFVIDNYEG